MDYPRDNIFTYAFSTYKKTTGIAFAAIILLAIPITIAMLGQQQDIRQRASPYIPNPCSTDNDCRSGYACMGVAGDESGQAYCQLAQPAESACSCDGIDFVVNTGSDLTKVAAYAKGGNIVDQKFFLLEQDASDSTTGQILRQSEAGVPAVRITNNRYVSTWNFSMPQLKPDKSYRLYSTINCGANDRLPAITQQVPYPSIEPSNISLFQKTCNVLKFTAKEENACAEDAKICADGTTVGRTGPNCQFNCPGATGSIFDLNEDGVVNAKDLNILYTGFSNRQGD